MPIKLCLFFLLYFISFYGFSNIDDYRFNRLDIADGLSNNNIRAIFKDADGFIWFGSIYGLNRYDGNTVVTFTHDYNDPGSIPDNFIYHICQDPSGKLWIHTRKGYCLYDPVKEKFEPYPEALLQAHGIQLSDISMVLNGKNQAFYLVARNRVFRMISTVESVSLQEVTPAYMLEATDGSTDINAIHDDADGMLWLIWANGIIIRYNPENATTLLVSERLRQLVGDAGFDYELFVDRDNRPWIYCSNQSKGVFHYQPEKDLLYAFSMESSRGRINNNTVTDIVQDSYGMIWIATDHGGINLMDPVDFSVQYLLHSPLNDFSLPDNAISCLYHDRDGIIWIGTYKNGIGIYHQNLIRFPLVRFFPDNQTEPGINDINCFEEDDLGNLWIGTNGGGLIYYDIQHKSYTIYRHDADNPASLGSDVVVSLLIDHQGVLWVGTYHGGLNKHLGNGRFMRFKHDPSAPHTISDDKIWALHEDSRRKLWIGTLSKGIDTLDRGNNQFVSLRHGRDYKVYSDAINAIKEDSEGYIWVATADGVTRIHDANRMSTHYFPQSDNPCSISHDLVNSILIDSRGLVWAGTMDGLNLYFRSTNNFLTIRKKDGLSDNIIRAILEDRDGHIWVSTANGITQIIVHPTTDPSPDHIAFDFFIYDEADGLQGRDFNVNAAFTTQDGKLLFGGSAGTHLFAPEQIERNQKPPEIILTGLQVFNEPVRVGQKLGKRIVLPRSFSKTESIELRHHENVFSIEFAALNFLNPGKNQYAYMLEGFNKDWIYLDSEEPRRATYTNLDPGNYIFRVKASNNDGMWNEEGVRLAIKVLPPFWESGYAMALYAIILSMLLLLARYIVLQKERFNYRIAEQKQEAQRRHEMDMLKIKFFTNISHELRTPLSLIISPIERTLQEINEGELKSRLETVNKNARRLMARVNQLLDFRRLETDEIKLNPEKTDIVAFIKETTFSFSDFSDTKNIRLTFESSLEELITCVDRDKLEKIMFNLLSNAFKFTSENGTIQVTLDSEYPEKGPDRPPQQAIRKIAQFHIVVKDNGIGIPEDQLERIFDRFFQNESAGSLLNQGSGIGLALCKEYVRLHGGSIHATSKVGQGSSFVVALPLNEKNDSVSDGPLKESIICQGSKVPVFHKETQGITDPSKPLLLLVEDNDDFRFYMKDNLRNSYNIIEASDGHRGLVIAKKRLPDLVITDLMMPEMDGYQLCKAIKTTPKTSHIPVVILTAQAMTDHQIAGFENGADDYLVKPFSMQLLEARIKNLIRFRKQPVKAWETIAEKQSGMVNITSQDELFITRVVKHIESNLSDASYTVENLSHQMCISRVHLYKKLMTLSGMAPTDFIRYMRMKRAASLLKESQLNVAEVCYQVGYNDPKHFSAHFKKEYKATPSAYKKQFYNRIRHVNQPQQSG